MKSLGPKGTASRGTTGKLQRYAVVKVLGRGAFGTAYLVRRKADSFQYVMKKLALEQLGEKERNEAMNECTVLAKLRSHPNIVSVLEHFVEEKSLCIVMEYADGGDLAQRIEHQASANATFPEDDVLDWFVQVRLRMARCDTRLDPSALATPPSQTAGLSSRALAEQTENLHARCRRYAWRSSTPTTAASCIATSSRKTSS